MIIRGYAALFEIADGAGDVIECGAFAASILRDELLPLYWQHRPSQRIGAVQDLREDVLGLEVVARIECERARSSIQTGVLGLSFGYLARRFRRLKRGRLLTEIDLFEVSVVTHPLQPDATIREIVLSE